MTKTELQTLHEKTKNCKSEIILNDQRQNWRALTPIDLHQVLIGPPQIDFSHVTVKSAASRNIQIMNNLDEDILFELEISSEELELGYQKYQFLFTSFCFILD